MSVNLTSLCLVYVVNVHLFAISRYTGGTGKKKLKNQETIPGLCNGKIHSFSLRGKSKFPLQQTTSMSLKYGRKPESAKETHANTQHANSGMNTSLFGAFGFIHSEGTFTLLHYRKRL